MNGTKAYILSASYTRKSLDGIGALKGVPATIKSITPSADGLYTTVTFEWTSNSGVVEESDLRVMNGLGIKSLVINTDGHLIVLYDDDTVEDVGSIPTKTVEVGDVETVEYDEGAKVEAQPTATGIKLNFSIPRGQAGTSDPVWNII